MDEFDRDRQSRESRGSRRGSEREIRRRPITDDDLDSDLQRRQPTDRSRRQSVDPRERDDRTQRRTRTASGDDEPIRRPPDRDRDEQGQRYSDRFRRSQQRQVDEDIDVAPASRDPYDRLRRLGNRPQRRVEPILDDERDIDLDDYDDFEQRPARRRTRQPRSETLRAGSAQMRSMGALLVNPTPENRSLAFGGLAAAASLIVLVLLILIRHGSAPAWIPIHLNAEGTPVRFGTTNAIWRLPVFALFASGMAFGLGYALRKREPFAVEFLAVGTIMIHVIVWVAVITLLW